MFLRCIAVLAALCLLPGGPTAAQARFDFERQTTLLPKSVLPLRAQLRLELDPDQPLFAGDVTLTVQVRKPVATIALHALDLQADAVTLLGAGAPRVLDVTADAATAQWRLAPADTRPIAPGRYRLNIRYRGKVQQTGEGLYVVEHRVDGKPMRMLATQLEATSARQLVPGFDEPVFRAPFELEVLAPTGYTVLSNTPLREAPAADGAGRMRHRFVPTPSMPSYLLAVAVGRFDVLQSRVGSTPLRIFTAPGKAEQARFAMRSTQQVLPYFSRYFGRPYALSKLDQLAVPGVREGAMEDWGLISYIENALLFDEGRSAAEVKRRVFSIVAHEIAHQWFGNLVSLASWDEVWLNEAFATWMQQKASARFHPEWQTPLSERSGADRTLDRDATAATRAIRAGPVNEAAVFAVFDDITYVKGGAVLSMLEQWVGPAAFQRGLAAYMAERAMKPATAGDLWFHIGRAAGRPTGTVAAVAASWTDQKGVPLLELHARCEQGQTAITLRQNRFTLGEPLPATVWHLPVTLARGSERRTVLMTEAEHRLRWPGCDDRPVLANAGAAGYYRVDHDAATHAKLAAGFTALAPVDRVALLSDSFALVKAGRRAVDEHLALLAKLPQVGDASRAALFNQALQQWRQLEAAFEGTPAQSPLRAAGQALFVPEFERLGWQPRPSESTETGVLRAALVQRLARLGHAGTLAGAHQRFAAALAADTARVPGSLRGSVLAAVGVEPDAAEFEALWNALQRSESQEERWLLLEALCAGSDAARAERLLGESLSGRLPPDLSVAMLRELGAVQAMVPRVYAFAVEHWPALAKLGGEGPFGGRNWLLPGVAWWSSDRALAARLRDDQQRLAGDPGASTAERVAASIEVRAALREREAAALAAALQDWAPQR